MVTANVHERPVLLIGGTGMLGRAIARTLAFRGIDYIAPSSAVLDLRDRNSIDAYFSRRISTVINCAGWTDVDGAEARPGEALALNGTAAGWLAEAAKRVKAPLVHFSSDYVFDGAATQPYRVCDARFPASVYGRTKAIGEDLIAAAGGEHLILRTSWLYAAWGKNFVRTMIDLMRSRRSLSVVGDQVGRPTAATVLAKFSLDLLWGGYRGTWHVTNAGACSWHEFACAIAGQVGSECEIEPCSTAEFARAAKRPHYSVLDVAATERAVGILPHWRQSLAETVAALLAPATPTKKIVEFAQ